jgi:hypothetical protein
MIANINRKLNVDSEQYFWVTKLVKYTNKKRPLMFLEQEI